MKRKVVVEAQGNNIRVAITAEICTTNLTASEVVHVVDCVADGLYEIMTKIPYEKFRIS